MMSTTKIYKLEGDDSNKDCVTMKCTQSINFNWVGSRVCNMNFVCPSLKNDICGSYGIHLYHHHPSMPRNSSAWLVCQENKLYQKSLDPGSQFEISLWFYSGYKFSAACYMWCTFDGLLPSSGAGRPDPADDIALAQLVNFYYDYIFNIYMIVPHPKNILVHVEQKIVWIY